MIRTALLALAGSFSLAAVAPAQTSPFEVSYDEGIPTLVEVYGYDFGDEITTPEDAVDYLRTLAAAAPDRMRVVDYAQSWQGRDLVYGVIASRENMARLDEIQADIQRLADPDTLDAATREALLARVPSVVWLGYSVHGDEISPTDSGLMTAYHLLAAEDDAVVQSIFADTIVIIDPIQNPDGRARFIASFANARGLQADEDRYAVEHDQPWPRGRFNHYLFDLNRDWFTLSQPETRGRVAAMQDWHPQVVVDSHEMGGDSTYFFAPSAEPFNPNIIDAQRQVQDTIGRNNGGYFDLLGYEYFTREIFDAFYPGYGDMWPTMQGGVGMTYEQASARGLFWRQNDGDLLTYQDGVHRNFVASLSTAEATARNRRAFLESWVEARSGADGDGAEGTIIDASTNRWNAENMARQLVAQGIRVERLDGRVNACGATYSDGAFLVRYDQPSGRLARTLLEPTTDLPADFMAEQERRREAGLAAQLYDVTAWSLPLMHNVPAASCRRLPALSGEQVNADDEMPHGSLGGEARWGYVIPWDDAGQARLVAQLAREGIPMRSTDSAFRIGSTTYPRGSVVIPRAGAPVELDFTLARLAAESGARYAGMASSWVDDGPNFGSSDFQPIRAPRIALAWGNGTSPTSTGATRYVLEQRFGLPVTIIRPNTLMRADLSRYDVIILPDQGFPGYSSTLQAAPLQEFAREGGTLIGLGSATRWLSDPDNGFIPAQRERAADTPRDTAATPSATTDGIILTSVDEREAAEASAGSMPDNSPGAMVNIVANPNSWLSAGYDGGAAALVTGSDIYAPVAMDDADTVMRYAEVEDLLAGGYLWEDYAEQLAQKPYLIARSMGSGQVIAFTQSPTTRAYLNGLDLLLMNAVILGPARSGRLR